MFGFIVELWSFAISVIGYFLPPRLETLLQHYSNKLLSFLLQTENSIFICEYHHSSEKRNELFESVQAYLTKPNFLSSIEILNYSKTMDRDNPIFTMEFNQAVLDNFEGIPIEWTFFQKTRVAEFAHPWPSFKLSFHKKHKDSIQSRYLPFVIEEGDQINSTNRKRKIYSNRSTTRRTPQKNEVWSDLPFSHPSNFGTVALDPARKDEIKADLHQFVNRKEFYTRVGRAWKRGYLLYGPPGTGKTSLIAAIANFLDFDIYDLELTAVSSNLQLRDLLNSTKSKSVIVVEDVDCSLHLSDRKEERIEYDLMGNRRSTVTLSGVLNVVDGLWSSWVGERLMIFTTNYKENIDPALLRAGRMDKHIELGFCQFEAFKILAKNYLGIDHNHELMEEVEQLLPAAEITPADVAEIFTSCNDDVEMGMRNALEEMKKRVAKMEMEMEKKIEMEEKEKEMAVTEEDATVKNEEEK